MPALRPTKTLTLEGLRPTGARKPQGGRILPPVSEYSTEWSPIGWQVPPPKKKWQMDLTEPVMNNYRMY